MTTGNEAARTSAAEAGESFFENQLIEQLEKSGIHGPIAEAIAEDDEAIGILVEEGTLKTF